MLSLALQNLRRDSEMRVATDTRVSPLWMLLPVGEAVLGVIYFAVIMAMVFAAIGPDYTSGAGYDFSSISGLISGTTAFFMLGFVLLYLAFLYVIYTLIRRRNGHFARQQRLFTDLEAALREIASKKGTGVDSYLGSFDATLRESQIEETEKSAVLWVILYVIPVVNLIAGLYILYFLTGDYFKHERREDAMIADASRALSALGIGFSFNRYEPLPNRSFVLYIILTLITLGIFSFYWEYVLIQDPNKHFANHVRFEESLLQSIAPVLT
ncbi:MAG TPA: DUF4234 domain-containing protein [Conexivisphaerales archaeon]|nr:DUF4234 domain-containing protein [Conexivisphaerales archaeon]